MKRPLVVRMVALLLAILLTGCGSTPSPSETSIGDATKTRAEATTATEIDVTDTSIEATTASSIPVVTESTVPAETTVPPETIAETVPETIAETVAPTTAPTEAPEVTEPVEKANLTTTQRNSINMLNYITVLTQAINVWQ